MHGTATTRAFRRTVLRLPKTTVAGTGRTTTTRRTRGGTPSPPDGAGGPPSSSGVDPATGYRRKDSLTRAQELTSLRPPSKALATQSFHAGENQTKGSLISDVESERKYRTELERRLAETAQREAELANENARLERSLADVRGQFDRAAAEARSGRYSGSEQASRIKDMERKLKVERERYEELERERDTMKEEYDQDLEEQKVRPGGFSFNTLLHWI